MEQYLATASNNEKNALLDSISELQADDHQKMVVGLINRCFGRCVNTFKSRTLDKNENQCVNACVAKFMQSMQRTAVRFAEENQAMAQQR